MSAYLINLHNNLLVCSIHINTLHLYIYVLKHSIKHNYFIPEVIFKINNSITRTSMKMSTILNT